ncbi:MAG: FAD:protein FMN transferase [Eubacteriales bacterium]|nr:FAD:protein FMN transferase [Eubacteriales bacterium]
MRILSAEKTCLHPGKTLIVLFLLLVMIFSGVACTEKTIPDRAEELTRFSAHGFYGFDTLTYILAYLPSAEEFERLNALVEDRLSYYNELYTAFEPSDNYVNVFDLNDRAGHICQDLEPDLFNLLSVAVELAKASEGAFNPAMGRLTGLWKEAGAISRARPDEAYIPDELSLKEAGKHMDYLKLRLEPEDKSVQFLDDQMRLDLGAMAKGYAVELLAKDIQKAGFNHVLLSVGGNVRAIGSKPEGQAWQVGIQDPELHDQVLETLEICDGAVVTSGVYERNFSYEGKLCHHIIDPQTLYPSERYLSVSLIGPDSGLADALATALFNLDEDKGNALAEKYGYQVIRVFPDGKVHHFTPLEK